MDDTFQIRPDVVGGNADGFDPLLPGPLIPALIRVRSDLEIMGESINFNCHRGSLAVEVEYEGSERMLLAELQACRTKPQHTPKPNLRGAHPLSELASFVNGQDPSTSFAGPPPREIAGRMFAYAASLLRAIAETFPSATTRNA